MESPPVLRIAKTFVVTLRIAPCLALLLGLLGSVQGRFWQGYSDAALPLSGVYSGEHPPARCRENQVMTSMKSGGNFLQCANADMDTKATRTWTGWVHAEDRLKALEASCPPNTFATGLQTKYDPYLHRRLECTPPREPLTFFSDPGSEWSAPFSDSPEEPAQNSFVVGISAFRDYRAQAVVKLQYARAAYRNGTAFRELTTAQVKQSVRSSATVLDLASPSGYVVATSGDGRVWLGSKVPDSTRNTSFRGSRWDWHAVPGAPWADYRLFTFQTALPSGGSFTLKAPADPTDKPDLYSIVALAIAEGVRLTCFNVYETVAVNSTTSMKAMLYCLPFYVIPPRTVLISDPTDKVDITAALAIGTSNNFCAAPYPAWARDHIQRGANNTGPWFRYKQATGWRRTNLASVSEPAPGLSFPGPDTYSLSEAYGVLALHLKNQMMAQFDQVGYPLIRPEIQMFLRVAYANFTTNCWQSSSLKRQAKTQVAWDFLGKHVVSGATASETELGACKDAGFTAKETLKLTFDIEVRNRHLAETLVDAYANMVAAASQCYVRQASVTDFTISEMICDISLPYHVGLSIWELGGEQATMSATAEKRNCAAALAREKTTCPAWVGIISGLLGALIVPASAGAAAAAAPAVAAGIIGTVCASLDTAAAA